MEKWCLRWLICGILGLGSLGVAPRPAAAEDAARVSVPAETKFVLRLNVQGFRDTDIGGRLFEMAKREALKELSENLPGGHHSRHPARRHQNAHKEAHDRKDREDRKEREEEVEEEEEEEEEEGKEDEEEEEEEEEQEEEMDEDDESSESDEEGLSPEESLEKIKDMLGFDPFEEIRDVTISASEYEHPEKSLVAVVRMKKSTGNLEGLMLGLPGYAANEYHEHTVHSASPDQNVSVYLSIHTSDGGEKTLVAAPQRDAVEHLLDQLDGRDKDGTKILGMSQDSRDALLELRVLEIPMDKIGEGPQANIAKIIDDLSVRIGEAQDSLLVDLVLSTKKEEQAEQLRQMAQGMMAAIDFAKSADPDDEDLQKFSEFAKDMKAKREGNEVKVGIKIPTKELLQLIEKEMHD